MKGTKYLILILLLGYSFTCTAKIYQWVDANGVTQFTQTPPHNKAGKKKTKVKEVIQRIKKSSHIDEAGYVCNTLNVTQFLSELALLGHLRRYLSSFEEMHIEALADYQDKLNSRYISSIEPYKQKVEDLECMVKWSKKKIAKMEPLRLQYIADLEEAKKAVDRVPNGHSSHDLKHKLHNLSILSHGLIEPLKDLVHKK